MVICRRIGSWLSGASTGTNMDNQLEDDTDWYYDDDKKCWQKRGAETEGNTTTKAPPPKGKAGALSIDTAAKSDDGPGRPPTPGDTSRPRIHTSP